MSALHRHVEDYLRLRRALGFKLRAHGDVLPQLADYLEAAGATTITAELAVSFAQLPQDVQPIVWAHRLSMVRGFARYLETIDPTTEVPPFDVFGTRYQRPTPYLWQEMEVLGLMEAASQLQPALRACTYETFFGLLWTTGMRIGEAIGLERADVDLTTGVLTIRKAKGGRSRLVPLQKSATDALASYAARRERLCPEPKSQAFFVSSVGTTLLPQVVGRTFDQIATAIGLRTETKRPRIHDLRHAFAVRLLVSWYRSGVDAATGMGLLATYLGHVNPVDTYWYLSVSPELIELMAARLDGRAGAGRL
ncbi:MAG: tyrosine-type recombinase/integrase [Actinomycetota bacterium]|jgi:integrase|nr:tyrosine-type recombinase/integrase [Actinomycetota bacterium]